MKRAILLSAITLCLFATLGCEKELSEIDIIKQKLIGTWEWQITYCGGFVGERRPKPGQKREIIFTENRVLITDNLEIVDKKPVIIDKKKVLQDGSYTISKEQDKLYITIIPKEGAEDLLLYSGKRELKLSRTGDTLYLHGPVYKKVN